MRRGQGLNLPAINAEVDRRGFVPVSEKMEVLDKSGKPVTNVFCIGDANGEPSPASLKLVHLCVLKPFWCFQIQIQLERWRRMHRSCG